MLGFLEIEQKIKNFALVSTYITLVIVYLIILHPALFLLYRCKNLTFVMLLLYIFNRKAQDILDSFVSSVMVFHNGACYYTYELYLEIGRRIFGVICFIIFVYAEMKKVRRETEEQIRR
jgi:hypothetical protein